MNCFDFKEDEISCVQIRSMEYVLLEMIENEIINDNTSVDELLVYCAEVMYNEKEKYLSNKAKENYTKENIEKEINKDFC